MICNETSKTSFFLALAYAARTLEADTHLLIDAEECLLLLASNLESLNCDIFSIINQKDALPIATAYYTKRRMNYDEHTTRNVK
jgi:hypothetical protein